jgi:hypothetical protein
MFDIRILEARGAQELSSFGMGGSIRDFDYEARTQSGKEDYRIEVIDFI